MSNKHPTREKQGSWITAERTFSTTLKKIGSSASVRLSATHLFEDLQAMSQQETQLCAKDMRHEGLRKGAEAELSACMYDRKDWSLRREAQLRPPR